MEEKDIVKVTLHYEDGSVEEVEKGIMIREEVVESAEITKTTFYPVNIRTLDIANITVSLIQFADKLGIFDNIK